MERDCLAVRRRLQAGLQLQAGRWPEDWKGRHKSTCASSTAQPPTTPHRPGASGGGTSARITGQKRKREYALNDWQPVHPKDTPLTLPSKPQRAFRPTHGSDAEMTAAAADDAARRLDSDVLLTHQRRLAALKLGLPGTPAVLACALLPCTPPATSTYVQFATGRRTFSPRTVLLLECA